MELSNDSGVIESLIDAVKNVQDDDPGAACQLMLACSVFQNYANQRQSALETTHRVLALAKQTKLTQEFICANWGASAICIQQGSYIQAITYLDDLQTTLSKVGEWVLADFIDVIKQSLIHPVMTGMKPDEKTPESLLNNDLVYDTFSWIQQWGLESQTSTTESSATNKNLKRSLVGYLKSLRALFSASQWHVFWQHFKRIFKGILNLWEKNNTHPAKKGFILGQSLSNSSLHLLPSDKDIEKQAVEDYPISTISPPAKADSPPPISLTALSAVSKDEKISEQTDTVIPMTVQMLGAFGITIQDSPIKLHTTRGLSLLKYLLFHHKQRIPREVLMDIFWPDAEPETARNNLNVAMHGLRRALRTSTFLPVIVFEDGAYGLDPILQVWLDVEEFERCIKAGQRLEGQKQLTIAVTEYEIAVNLYQGDFLADTPYEGWTVLDRERLRIAYLETLDHLSQIYFSQERYAACATMCQLILNRDLCREDAHCRLMRCYSRLGQVPLALRQYQICVQALQSELEVDPAPETTRLYERIRKHEGI
jgi:DNA-binding SARP family transcriptional activator